MTKRNPYVVPAKQRSGGPMKNKKNKRKNNKNKQKEYKEEYDQDKKENPEES